MLLSQELLAAKSSLWHMQGTTIMLGFSWRINVLNEFLFPIITEALSQNTARIFEKGILFSTM